jgi:hypothetical protein
LLVLQGRNELVELTQKSAAWSFVEERLRGQPVADDEALAGDGEETDSSGASGSASEYKESSEASDSDESSAGSASGSSSTEASESSEESDDEDNMRARRRGTVRKQQAVRRRVNAVKPPAAKVMCFGMGCHS